MAGIHLLQYSPQVYNCLNVFHWAHQSNTLYILAEEFPGPPQTSKIEIFTAIVNCFSCSQNLDFLSLRNSPPGQFLKSSNSHRYHWILIQLTQILLNFKTSCCNLKIRDLGAKLCVAFLLLDPRHQPEGCYKIGSVRPSFRLFVRFLGVGSLVFSET